MEDAVAVVVEKRLFVLVIVTVVVVLMAVHMLVNHAVGMRMAVSMKVRHFTRLRAFAHGTSLRQRYCRPLRR
jgi:hypothetical protein